MSRVSPGETATIHPRTGGRDWWISVLGESFGLSFWLFAAFALLAAVISYVILGPESFDDAVSENLAQLGFMLPRVAVAQVVAGFVWVLMPHDRVSQLVGPDGGRRGLVIATMAGIITPGGPASAFSLLVLIGSVGGDRGILVAYISSWAMLGLQRILVWDLPLMGVEFSVIRFLVCLPLPILAGLIARRLPLRLRLVEHPEQQDGRRS